jgi:hypothetical protein
VPRGIMSKAELTKLKYQVKSKDKEIAKLKFKSQTQVKGPLSSFCFFFKTFFLAPE